MAKAPVEICDQHEERKLEEVKTNNIDPEWNILFTMNVDTQDINIVVDKTSENVEKKSKSLNVDTQHNVKKSTKKE